ncbi:hypothetical protein SAMN04488126_103154 [Bhargavaea beijingensis]|uniref:Uncharacterized protein n=1 Tax=Bhargavaea beijingensis TaxID=426756 RepID=A0A1G7A165_9BACL|nr:hypothetical protein SAMN04488126_103154 [Bhargavaea beijingensis]
MKGNKVRSLYIRVITDCHTRYANRTGPAGQMQGGPVFVHLPIIKRKDNIQKYIAPGTQS